MRGEPPRGRMASVGYPGGAVKQQEATMPVNTNTEVMLKVFRAVERRDTEGFRSLCQPNVELHWPPPLPYGGSSRAGVAPARQGPNWEETWTPLQPTEAERQMDPRVVAADEDEVVILWRQRGVSPAGERFDGQVLVSTRFAMASSPGRRCSTSIRPGRPDSSPTRCSRQRRPRGSARAPEPSLVPPTKRRDALPAPVDSYLLRRLERGHGP
jgi:ketosteroid isomerase-like protein